VSLTETGPSLIDLLVAARRDGRQIHELPQRLWPATSAEGYAAAEQVCHYLGWPTLGWKIAGTTEFVRRRLGLEGPIYGRTFQHCRHEAPVTLARSALLDPLVECEMFVTLARALPARDRAWTTADVIAAIDTVHAGVEIAECRFPTARMPSLPCVFADGCASGRYIFGPPIDMARTPLVDIAVEVAVNGTVRRTGRGADVMGDPIAPLVWLANALSRRGIGLTAGETISTGSCTGMLPVHAGDVIVARYAGVGEIRITLT
jgi:2-keto-4-pentenoate hydratase